MSHTYRQRRQTGDRRRSEVVKARIDPDFADRLDMACLRVGIPPSEFVRRALARELGRLETGIGSGREGGAL